jgi:hypothetical protein
MANLLVARLISLYKHPIQANVTEEDTMHSSTHFPAETSRICLPVQIDDVSNLLG